MSKLASLDAEVGAQQQQAAASLSALIESTEDLIWSVDLNFGLLTFNSALQRHMERNFGAQPVIGNRPEDLLPPERAALWPPLFQRALAEGPYRTEVPFPDRRTLEISFNLIVVDGKTTGISVFGRDIAERRAAKEARASLATLIETSEDAIIANDLGGAIVGWNRGAQQLLGYTSKEILGKDLSILIIPSHVEHMRENLKALGESRAVQSFDARLCHKDGGLIDVSLSISPICDAEGKVVGTGGIARDIRPRKRFERELQEAEKKYRDIFDGAPEGLFQSYLECKFITANPSLAKMLGYSSPDELMTSVQDLAHNVFADPEDHVAFRSKLEEHGIVRDLEYSLRRKDGEAIWGAISCRIVNDPDGSIAHFEGSVIDITARKQAETKLRESEQVLREAQRIGAIGSYVFDIQSGLWTGSDVLDELFGVPRGPDHTIESWIEIIHPEDRAMLIEYFNTEVLGKGKTFDKEFRIVRGTDKAERWLHAMGKLELDSHGQPLKTRGVIKDITERKLADLQLRASEERHRATFEQAAIGIVLVTFDGQILKCNARFAEIVGYTPEEALRLNVIQLTEPKYLPECLPILQGLKDESADTAFFEKRYIRKDGTLVWVRLTVSKERDSKGKALHMISFVEDINAQKMAEGQLTAAQAALRLSEERYRTVFQTSLDPITITRVDNQQYIEVNRAFLEWTGFERHEVIGRTALELNLCKARDREIVLEMLNRTSECRNVEIEFRKKSGQPALAMVSVSIVEIDGVQCVLGMARDITKAKAAEDEIRNLAFYDSLTGLPNRRLLLERLHQALAVSNRTGRMRALLFVDLDNFKTLNDTLGHQTGDLLLQEAARRLKTCVRDIDTVGRLGGDEFVLMLDDLNELPEDAAAQSKVVAEKILAAVGEPCRLAGREYSGTASIGISVFGDSRGSSSEVLQQADIAMYQAKLAGRNTMRFFAPALQAAVNARAEMEEELRLGIRASQFVLYYQPQIDRNRLVGAEALIRWNHPRRNVLLPGEFIPMAEQSGLILPLGKWVLQSACEQIAAWADHRQTARLSIAVNISASQFRQPDFVQQVLSALDSTGANPRNLGLELTESMLAENIEEVIEKMKDLKSHGLRFSLDDFGTGFSSLAYLKRLPLNQLKIDGSFIRDILMDQSSAAIAQTIVSLSRAMGLPVIAEGVETEEQREFLTRIGCHAFQGYTFSRPLPLDEFESQWLPSIRSGAQAVR
jgi:diguanylate cyclase (GGDEF)-like protein/PAS domain S-box-containing protein